MYDSEIGNLTILAISEFQRELNLKGYNSIGKGKIYIYLFNIRNRLVKEFESAKKRLALVDYSKKYTLFLLVMRSEDLSDFSLIKWLELM